MARTKAEALSDDDHGDKDYDELELDQDGEPNQFEIRDRVPQNVTVVRTCGELHRMMHDGEIELNPIYQRDVVWKPNRQSNLVDSLFKGLHVPPVVFAVRNDPELGQMRICVDGKQRLTSIQSFIDGHIPHIDPVTKRKYWMSRNLNPDNLKKKLLVPQYYEQMFHEIKITCVEYFNIDESTEKEIFERVQNGVPLQASEKMQALNGPLPTWISGLQSKFFQGSKGFGSQITLSTERAKDFELLARSIYTIAHMPTIVAFPGLQPLTKWLKTAPDPSPEFKTAMMDVLQAFLKIATEAQYRAAFTQVRERVAPVEWIFTAVILAKMRDCSFDTKAKQILKFRKSLREKFQASEIRANTQVCKWAFAFVNSVPAGVRNVRWPTDESLRLPARQVRSGGKRARGDDDDDEYRPNRRRG